VKFEAKDSVVVFMILKGCLPYSHILPFSKPLEFLGENLSVPNFIARIDHSYFRRVVIKLEHLEDLNLKIEIKMLVVLLDSI